MLLVSTTSRLAAAGAAVGALAGAAIFALLLDHASGIAVIQTGRVGGIETGQGSVSRSAPVTLAERLQTTAFAKRIAARVGLDPIDLVPARYGGNGMLRVRLIGDGSMIELTSRAPNPETALKIVATAAELAVADDRAMLAPLRALIVSRIAELSRERAAAEARTAPNPSAAASPAVAAIAEALAKSPGVSDGLWAVQSGAVAPASQEAAVIEVALSKPRLAHWWQAALLGMLAGALIGSMAGVWLQGRAGTRSARFLARA